MRDYGSAKLYYQFTMEKYISVIKPKARLKLKLSVSVSNAVVISKHLNYYSFARPSAVQGNPEQLPLLLNEFRYEPTRGQIQGLGCRLGHLINSFEAFKRCKLNKDLIVGLKASQRDINLN